MEIRFSGNQCPVLPQAKLGEPVPGGNRIANGMAGASVDCRVHELPNGNFEVFGSMSQAGNHAFTLAINGSIMPFASASASISSVTVPGFSGENPSTTPCTVALDSTADVGGLVGPGFIRATFSCTEYVDPSTPATMCRADGALVFELCDLN